MPIGTRHDATKVMLGASLVPADQASVESVPGNIPAGYGVRKNTSTGVYQVAASGAGPLLGISMGPSLGKSGMFSLCYSSPKVLLRLASVEPTEGDQVRIDDSTGTAAAATNTLTAAVYEKILIGGGIDEVTGEAVNVAIINMTSGL